MKTPGLAVRAPWATRDGRAPFSELDIGPNRVALLKDGYQAYPTMLDAIAGATSTICLETYIFRADTAGRRFGEALMAKAREGVEVLLSWDYWGSSVPEEYVAQLKSAGVKVLVFMPLHLSGRLGRILVKLRRRNHRKALIVDGQVAFAGGLNISDDYAAVVDGGEGWRDTHVRIVGPSAQDLERLFLATWRTYKGPRFDEKRFKRPPGAACARIEVLGNDFRKDRRSIRKAYVDAFSHARHSILLTHAYFLPPARVIRALTRAARRGVRVAVILAGETDVKLVLYAARWIYGRLLRSNIEIYEWEGRVLHAKTAVADTTWCTIGSANLDALSLRSNLEVNAVFIDPHMAAAVERLFEEDLTHCRRVTLETVRGYGWLHRAASWFAWQLRYWL